MVKYRWPDGVVKCPRCGRDDPRWLANQKALKRVLSVSKQEVDTRLAERRAKKQTQSE